MSEEPKELEIERIDTGVRVLLSILFLLIAEVVEIVLRVLTAFSLLITFVTGRPPSAPVRRLANQASTYLYRLYRYATYNESTPPFPFSELTDVIEPEHWEPDERESELIGRGRRAPEER